MGEGHVGSCEPGLAECCHLPAEGHHELGAALTELPEGCPLAGSIHQPPPQIWSSGGWSQLRFVLLLACSVVRLATIQGVYAQPRACRGREEGSADAHHLEVCWVAEPLLWKVASGGEGSQAELSRAVVPVVACPCKLQRKGGTEWDDLGVLVPAATRKPSRSSGWESHTGIWPRCLLQLSSAPCFVQHHPLVSPCWVGPSSSAGSHFPNLQGPHRAAVPPRARLPLIPTIGCSWTKRLGRASLGGSREPAAPSCQRWL